MRKRRIKPFRPVYPSPAALITSVDKSGRANIITLAEVFNISVRDPVIVGIAIRPATYSYSLIKETREFTVNLPTASILKKVDRCGCVSGRDGIDKFRMFGLTAIPADEVKPPLIAECPVNIECKVLDVHKIGDHDLFLGDVVAVHVDEDKIEGEDKISTEKLDVLSYLMREYWSLEKRIGEHGFTRGTLQ